jgi:LysR family transcriptional regulator (chromosome initiation inhibitor)
MLDYAQLEALAAVVRYGAFDKAARVLNVTPSAVSQRIKALEDTVGQVLVVRTQPCRATVHGEALCRHVERVVLLEHELDLAAERAPTIRIAVNADSAATWFIDAIADTARELGVLFDFVIDDQDHTVELLRRGEVQAAVSSAPGAVRGCTVTKLGALRFLATCSPEFHARHFAEGITTLAMLNAPCLVFEPKDRLQHRFIRRVTRARIEPPIHWLPNLHGFTRACLKGLAWGMQPELLAREHLTSGALVELIPNRPIDVRLYWHSSALASSTITALTRAITQNARQSLR